MYKYFKIIALGTCFDVKYFFVVQKNIRKQRFMCTKTAEYENSVLL